MTVFLEPLNGLIGPAFDHMQNKYLVADWMGLTAKRENQIASLVF